MDNISPINQNLCICRCPCHLNNRNNINSTDPPIISCVQQQTKIGGSATEIPKIPGPPKHQKPTKGQKIVFTGIHHAADNESTSSNATSTYNPFHVQAAQTPPATSSFSNSFLHVKNIVRNMTARWESFSEPTNDGDGKEQGGTKRYSLTGRLMNGSRYPKPEEDSKKHHHLHHNSVTRVPKNIDEYSYNLQPLQSNNANLLGNKAPTTSDIHWNKADNKWEYQNELKAEEDANDSIERAPDKSENSRQYNKPFIHSTNPFKSASQKKDEKPLDIGSGGSNDNRSLFNMTVKPTVEVAPIKSEVKNIWKSFENEADEILANVNKRSKFGASTSVSRLPQQQPQRDSKKIPEIRIDYEDDDNSERNEWKVNTGSSSSSAASERSKKIVGMNRINVDEVGLLSPHPPVNNMMKTHTLPVGENGTMLRSFGGKDGNVNRMTKKEMKDALLKGLENPEGLKAILRQRSLDFDDEMRKMMLSIGSQHETGSRDEEDRKMRYSAPPDVHSYSQQKRNQLEVGGMGRHHEISKVNKTASSMKNETFGERGGIIIAEGSQKAASTQSKNPEKSSSDPVEVRTKGFHEHSRRTVSSNESKGRSYDDGMSFSTESSDAGQNEMMKRGNKKGDKSSKTPATDTNPKSIDKGNQAPSEGYTNTSQGSQDKSTYFAVITVPEDDSSQWSEGKSAKSVEKKTQVEKMASGGRGESQDKKPRGEDKPLADFRNTVLGKIALDAKGALGGKGESWKDENFKNTLLEKIALEITGGRGGPHEDKKPKGGNEALNNLSRDYDEVVATPSHVKVERIGHSVSVMNTSVKLTQSAAVITSTSTTKTTTFAREELSSPQSRRKNKNSGKVRTREFYICQKCHKIVESFDAAIYTNGDSFEIAWHPHCFRCYKCEKDLSEEEHRFFDEEPYCLEHYVRIANIPKCFKCQELISDPKYTSAAGNSWHRKHFTCQACKKPLVDTKYVFIQTQNPYCLQCHGKLFPKQCKTCQKWISPEEPYVQGGNSYWHWSSACLYCLACKGSLVGRALFFRKDGRLYCNRYCACAYRDI